MLQWTEQTSSPLSFNLNLTPPTPPNQRDTSEHLRYSGALGGAAAIVY